MLCYWCCGCWIRYQSSQREWQNCSAANLFACLASILVLAFQACSWESGLSTTGELGQGQCEMLHPANILSSNHLWQGRSHSCPHSYLCWGKKKSQRGSILCTPRTRLEVSSSFQIILQMTLRWKFKCTLCTAVSFFSGHRSAASRLLFVTATGLGFAEL